MYIISMKSIRPKPKNLGFAGETVEEIKAKMSKG